MKNYKLIFEPFCYYECIDNRCLIYNELENTFLIHTFKKAPFLMTENKSIVILTSALYQNEKEFIEKLITHHCASLYYEDEINDNVCYLNQKPFIELDYRVMRPNRYAEVKSVFRAVFMYPNHEISYLDVASRQFPCLENTLNAISNVNAIDKKILKNFLTVLPYSAHTFFFIISDNAVTISKLLSLFCILRIPKNRIVIRCTHTSYSHIKKTIDIDYKIEKTIDSHTFLKERHSKEKENYIVTVNNQADWEQLMLIYSNTVRIVPVFKKDSQLFKTNLFISESDIHNRTHSLKSIIKHSMLNDNFYGCIHVFADGSIYTSLNNTAVIAHISYPINTILDSVFSKESSWFLTRKNKIPCKYCLYKNFCFSPSEYECYAQRFNFCTIRS